MIINLENIHYQYNQQLPEMREVLKGIDLQIGSGEFIGLVGATGSGKTTLLQHFTGLLKPSAGTVYIDGRNIWDKTYPINFLRKRIGLVFQFPESQLFESTIFEDIAFGPRALNLSPGEIEIRVEQAIKLVGMDYEKMKDRSPHHLSEGEKRRIALAGVLAMAPEMLILDEPTAGLDPAGTKLIINILKKLNEQGTTILFITHHLEVALQLANRILILLNGKLIFDGKKENLFDDETLLKNANLNIPRVVKVSQYLFRAGFLPDWKFFSKEQLKTTIKSTISNKNSNN